MEDFYDKCAEILGCAHEGNKFPHRRRTRWNNRVAGRGRFPGFGIIRRFNSNNIHVALSYPISLQKTFKSEDDVFETLKGLI